MGYEYWILKPKDKTTFNLGKGAYNKPLEEFGQWNGREAMEKAKNGEEHTIAHKIDFNRKMMANNLQDFIALYKAGTENEYVYNEGNYIEETAEKIWNWLGDDDVWIYGEDIFDYLSRNEWKETGTRYVEK